MCLAQHTRIPPEPRTEPTTSRHDKLVVAVLIGGSGGTTEHPALERIGASAHDTRLLSGHDRRTGHRRAARICDTTPHDLAPVDVDVAEIEYVPLGDVDVDHLVGDVESTDHDRASCSQDASLREAAVVRVDHSR